MTDSPYQTRWMEELVLFVDAGVLRVGNADGRSFGLPAHGPALDGCRAKLGVVLARAPCPVDRLVRPPKDSALYRRHRERLPCRLPCPMPDKLRLVTKIFFERQSDALSEGKNRES